METGIEMGHGGFVDVMSASELTTGSQRTVLVNGRSILLCRTEAGVFALANLCPHAQQPLEGGPISGGTIRCPRHGACFDIASGAPLNTVTKTPVKTFPARERAARIEVEVPPASRGYFPDFSQGA